jgi:signal transduction histidine kinase
MLKKYCHIILFFLTLAGFARAGTGEPIDSIKALLPNARQDTSTVSLYIHIAKHYYHSDPDSTFKYAKQALLLSNALDFPLGKGKAYRMIGIAYSAKSDLDKALEFLFLALNEYKNAQSIKDIGVIYTSIGIVYRKKSDYDKALDYYLKSLEIIKIENNPAKVSSALNNIGTIYRDLKDYDQALRYFNEALEINKEANHLAGLCYNYANIGVIYKLKNDFEPAIANLKEALAMFEDLNYKNEVAQVYSNLGEIYIAQGHYDNAFNSIQTANRIYYETSNRAGISETLLLLSRIYLNQKKYTSAKSAINLAMDIAVKTGFKEHELESYLQMSKVDSATGQFRNSFLYRNKYHALKDSIFGIEKNKIISDIQEKYNVSEKEKENIILRNDIEMNMIKIRKQNILNYIISFSAVLLLLIIVLIVYSMKKIRKSHALLLSKNEEIRKQNEELENYKNKLELIVEERTKELNDALMTAMQSNRLKTQFLENLYHEIRTPMNAILGFADIYKNKVIDSHYLNEIRKSNEDLLETIDRLVIFSKFQLNDYILNLKPINIEEYFTGLYTAILEKRQYLNKDFIDIILNADFSKLPQRFISDEFVLNSILRELIDNAFKFTEKGKITITPAFADGLFIIEVCDTGVGIKEELSEKVFEFTEKFDQEKEIYRGMGVGLAMVKKGVELLSGNIRIKTDRVKGAELIISLPELSTP